MSEKKKPGFRYKLWRLKKRLKDKFYIIERKTSIHRQRKIIKKEKKYYLMKHKLLEEIQVFIENLSVRLREQQDINLKQVFDNEILPKVQTLALKYSLLEVFDLTEKEFTGNNQLSSEKASRLIESIRQRITQKQLFDREKQPALLDYDLAEKLHQDALIKQKLDEIKSVLGIKRTPEKINAFGIIYLWFFSESLEKANLYFISEMQSARHKK